MLGLENGGVPPPSDPIRAQVRAKHLAVAAAVVE